MNARKPQNPSSSLTLSLSGLQIPPLLKLQTRKIPRPSKTMSYDTLNVDIRVLRWRPQLDEDEFTGTDNQSELVTWKRRARKKG